MCEGAGSDIFMSVVRIISVLGLSSSLKSISSAAEAVANGRASFRFFFVALDFAGRLLTDGNGTEERKEDTWLSDAKVCVVDEGIGCIRSMGLSLASSASKRFKRDCETDSYGSSIRSVDFLVVWTNLVS